MTHTHTPTPWSYTGTKEWATIYNVETHEHIAGIMTKGSKKENAEHIVHCVNAHDALVKALRATLMNAKAPHATDWTVVAERLEAALAQAERS